VTRLTDLGKPILLLHGRHDMTFPASLVEPTTALTPSARGVVIEEAGHMAHVDQPERWLAAIRAFLDEPDH
jgi:pimeloyl-ACP methyl ester carboxylesterase